MAQEPNSEVQLDSSGLGWWLAAIFFVLFVLSTVDKQPSERALPGAHAAGAKAGYQDGLQAGHAARIREMEREAFTRTIEEARASGSYFLMPLYCVGVGLLALVIGYILQFAFFYSLRRLGILSDVDRMLLPKSSLVAKLE
jgi:hypothetical protein